MAAAPLTWIPDNDTLFLGEMNTDTNANFGSPGPAMADSGPLHSFLLATGSPGITTGVTGNGRSFPAGSNFYFLTASGWLLKLRATKQMTVEAMVRVTALTAGAYPVVYTQNHAGSDNGTYIIIDSDGKVEIRFHADGGTFYYDIPGTLVPGVPGSDYVHIRSTCDWIAQEVKLWAGTPGQVLTLLATLPTASGLNFYNGTDVYSDALFGCVGGAVGLSGLDKVRISSIVRTDSFPTSGTPTYSMGSAVLQSPTRIRVMFGAPVTMASSSGADDSLNPHNYDVTPGYLQVSSVDPVASDTVDLNFASELPGATYSIRVHGIVSLAGLFPNAVGGADTVSVVVTVAPTILSVVGIPDTNHVVVNFSRSMDVASTTDAGNYTINNNVQVLRVERVTDTVFILHTSGENPGGSYQLTASSNIMDTNGNHLV